MSRVLAGDLEYKTVAPSMATRPSEAPRPQQSGEKGVVEFFAAVTGIRDEVDDVIVPGAFARTLRERTPKVCLNHEWRTPIGRTLEVKELLPGDAALPDVTNTGAPWPREAGALWVRALYNLGIPDGYTAFKNACFFPSHETQFSIGYKARKTTKRGGVRYLHDVDLYEYGPVLHAANPLAGLLSVKDALGDIRDQGDGYLMADPMFDVEVKARYVRDAAWWGKPVGSLIMPGDRPRGTAAVAARRKGEVPSPVVGTTTERPTGGVKPATSASRRREESDAGLFPTSQAGPSNRLRATRPKGRDQEYINAIADLFDPDEEIPDFSGGVWASSNEEVEDFDALDRLVEEGLTPAELEDELRDEQHYLSDDDPDARERFITAAVQEYRHRYEAARAGQQRDARRATESLADRVAEDGGLDPKRYEKRTTSGVVDPGATSHAKTELALQRMGSALSEKERKSPLGRGIGIAQAIFSKSTSSWEPDEAARAAVREPGMEKLTAKEFAARMDGLDQVADALDALDANAGPRWLQLSGSSFADMLREFARVARNERAFLAGTDNEDPTSTPDRPRAHRSTEVLDRPDAVVARMRKRLRQRGVSTAVYNTAAVTVRLLEGRAPDEDVANDTPRGIDPRRVASDPETGLMAVEPPQVPGWEPLGGAWQVFDPVTGGRLPVPEMLAEVPGGDGVPVTSRTRAQALFDSVRRLTNAQGEPPPFGRPNRAPDWMKHWRDAQGRDFPTALLEVAFPAYVRLVSAQEGLRPPPATEPVTVREGDRGPSGYRIPPPPPEFVSNANDRGGDNRSNRDSAQGASGDGGQLRPAGAGALPEVPADDLLQDQGQGRVLRGDRQADRPGDRPVDDGLGGDDEAGRDLRGAAEPDEDGAQRGGVDGDAGVPAAGGGRRGRAGQDSGGRRAGRGAGGLGRGAGRAGGPQAEGRTDAGVAGEDPQPDADPAEVEAVPASGQRFRPTGVEDLAPAGERSKLKANMEALRTLRRIQTEGRPATPEEQAVLARWAGWGGLPNVFDPAKPEYAAEREELAELLSPREMREARRNTLNAHYTDARVTRQLWDAVQDLGFTGGRVLEPGSGSGNFIGFAPESAQMVGVELDSTTAAISRALYPDAQIRNESFADTQVPDGSFDATVGNVPFGDFALTDATHNAAGESIHNHFILKSLALTRPGGLVAVLSSRYTLDSENSRAREKMAELGDLVGAVRLPTGSHQRASGTSVIEDVLIFRRREPDQPPADTSWVKARKVDVNGFPIVLNDYWAAHPDHVLGEVTAEKGQYGSGGLIVRGDRDMPGLAAALAGIVADARTRGLTATERDSGPAPDLVSPDQARHEGHIKVEPDGKFSQASGGASVPFDVPKTQAEELAGLVGIRDALTALLEAEAATTEDTPQIGALRRELNRRYDTYLAKFGPVSRYGLNKLGHRVTPAQGGFRRDPMSAAVRALEEYDPNTGTARKADVFRKRAVAPRVIATTADNPRDALSLSMDAYNEVNLPAIAGMLGVGETEARRQLVGELVFEQPPLTDSEFAAAARLDAVRTAGALADVDTSDFEAELSNVGDSVRQPGKLEPSATYLSGNVRRKLAAARAAAAVDPRFQSNVEALERVLPRELGPEEIDGRLGAPWIDADTVRQFVADLVEDRYGEVTVKKVGGTWSVVAPKWGNLATEVWGTRRKPVGALVQALLEQRAIKVVDTNDDGSTTPNLEATLAAQEKADEIQERFSEWLWEDPDRSRRLQARYNDMFNSIALRSYDGAQRTFPNMAAGWKPRPHQVAAVERIVSEPTAMLGHVVGAGKTAEMTMGAMELRRLGLAKKPAIVVPNHMLDQFSREFLEVYPQAKILAAGTDDLKGEKRREFVARAAVGEWDAVILTQSAFELIPMSKDQVEDYIDREMAEMREQLEEARAEAIASGDKALDKTVKKMEKALLRTEEALKKKLEKRKDTGISFEQTGIDYLMVDEAHQYSNLRTLSKIQGAGVAGSDKATDLHMKMEYLRGKSESGRIATFATGTPIRNTVTQMHVMMRFLRPDLLRDAGIASFDSWAATFGKVVEEMELKPEGNGFRQTSRFAKFRNVPELLRIFHTFSDIKLAEDLKLPTPNLVGGQVETVAVESSDELSRYIAELGERAELVRSRAVEPEDDNMLKISTDGRKAALSMALVGQDHQPGKIEAAADKISAIWRETKDKRYPKDPKDPTAGLDEIPGSLQIVFMDMGTPGNEDRWNGYDALRDELASRGMDPKTVRFIHEAKNDQEKAEMFAAARSGRISVLIGSSEKMGVGTNVQKRAVALHHMDAPWRPADVEQRDGRIMRQGNLNSDVRILRYVTEGSFDAYMWQTLERKAKFINQIMKGNLDVREIEDVGDTALSYAEVKALATGNPDLMEKATVDTLRGKLERLSRNHARNQSNMRSDITTFTAGAAKADADAAALAQAVQRRDRTPADTPISVTGRGTFDTPAEANEPLKQNLLDVYQRARYAYGRPQPQTIGTFRGFNVTATFERSEGKEYLNIHLDGVPDRVVRLRDQDLRTVSLAQRLGNALDALDAKRVAKLDQADTLRMEVERKQAQLGKPFAQQALLEAARKKSARLNTKITRDSERAKGAEIPFDPAIDTDAEDDPILSGGNVATTPPEEAPAPPPQPEPEPEPTEAIDQDDVEQARTLREEITAGTLEPEDVAAAEELRAELGERTLSPEDTAPARELAEDLAVGRITPPAAAAEPRAAEPLPDTPPPAPAAPRAEPLPAESLPAEPVTGPRDRSRDDAVEVFVLRAETMLNAANLDQSKVDSAVRAYRARRFTDARNALVRAIKQPDAVLRNVTTNDVGAFGALRNLVARGVGDEATLEDRQAAIQETAGALRDPRGDGGLADTVAALARVLRERNEPYEADRFGKLLYRLNFDMVSDDLDKVADLLAERHDTTPRRPTRDAVTAAEPDTAPEVTPAAEVPDEPPVTAPPRTEPAGRPASLLNNDPVPEFRSPGDAIAYVAGDDPDAAEPSGLFRAVGRFAQPTATKEDRKETLAELAAAGPQVLDGAMMLAAAGNPNGIGMSPAAARANLVRLREGDPTHPVVASRSNALVRMSALRQAADGMEPVDITGRIRYIVPARFGSGRQKQYGWSVLVDSDGEQSKYLFLPVDANVEPAADVQPEPAAAAAPTRRATRPAPAPSGEVPEEPTTPRAPRTRPAAATPAAPAAEEPTAEITPDEVAEMEAISEDAYGLYEAPDGEFEVSEEVGERQDRVEDLLARADDGQFDPARESTETLTSSRRDLADELRLQTELARRERQRRAERQAAAAAAASDQGDQADVAAAAVEPAERVDVDVLDAVAEPEVPAVAEPRARPGLAGAAEDYADALRADDAAARDRTWTRLESSLRRSRSDNESVRALRAYVEGTDRAEHDPDTVMELVAAVREELRQRRNEQARRRRLVKRLERERIRSLLGQVDAELRGNRGLDPTQYGGDVSALLRAAADEVVDAVTPPVPVPAL